MLKRINGFFKGEAQLCVCAEDSDRAVSVISRLDCSARLERRENGELKILISPTEAKKIASALDKSGIIVYINTVYGFKCILYALRIRLGILTGLAVLIWMLIASTSVIFTVDIEGALGQSRESIEAELSELGVRVGARIKDVDRAEAVSGFLKRNPQYSWASLDFDGTTARLMLLPRTEGGEESVMPRILVSDCDGVITAVSVYSGKALVSVGDVVKKGDLLISGYVSGCGPQYGDDPMLRYEGADGEVYAYVRESVSVTVPYESAVTEVLPVKAVGVTVSVLGRAFNVGRIEDGGAYRTEQRRHITLFSEITLPITYRVCRQVSEITETTRLNEAEAELKARAQAYKELCLALGQAELTDTEIKTDKNEGGVTVTVSYGCVRLISVPYSLETVKTEG